MISENYIRTLLVQNPKINIIDFAKQYNLLTKNIDVSFIDQFLSMVESDDFCIHHDMLYMYGVLSDCTTYDVKRLLEQYQFEEGEDYIVNRNIAAAHQGGSINNYFLKPDTFKMCLIRSLKTRKYARYYLFLEEVIYWFNKFQIQKLETDLFIANNKKIMNLMDNDKLDQVCIVKRIGNPKYKYNVIRGQRKHVTKVLKENDIEKDDILLLLDIPSGISFFNKVKEEITIQRERVYTDKISGDAVDEDNLIEDADYRVSTINNFNIVDMTEDQFKSKILDIFKSRFF